MWVRILLPVNIISSCGETGSTRQLEVLVRKLVKVQILSGRLYMVVVAQRQSGVLWTLRSRFQNSPTTRGSVLELVYIEVLETSAERIESSSLSWPTFMLL